MEILFATSELASFGGEGPAARMCAALPKALRGLDHRVTVVSPLYRGIDPTSRNLARRLMKLEFEIGGQTYACELYDGRTSGGVELLFVGHEQLFHLADHLEEGDDATVALRAGLFARAAVRIAGTRDPAVELLHVHDWPGGAVAVQAARAELGIPVLMTIHDASRRGRFEAQHRDAIGVQEQGPVDVLAAGIREAHRVTTVSPSYARELTRPEAGYGLEDAFAARRDEVTGILDGVDVSVWNPATDASLAARFDPIDRSGKERCKASVQKSLGLPVRADVPLLGAVGTDAPADGFDLLAKCMPQVLRNDVQVALQLEGSEALVERFEELSERFPDRLQVVQEPSSDSAHRIVGASDLMIVPARDVPSSPMQMYAHRYGSVPIARRAGSIADTVVDCDPELATGNGFLFDEADPEELLAAIRRGVAAWHERKAFDGLSRRVMRIDHSWERSGRLYERLYRELVDAQAG